MQVVFPGFPPSYPLPDTVQVALSVLQLNAMLAQDDTGVRESLLEAAEDCVQDYIQQVGRFEPAPPPTPAPPQPMTIDTQQIANYLQALAEGRCGR